MDALLTFKDVDESLLTIEYDGLMQQISYKSYFDLHHRKTYDGQVVNNMKDGFGVVYCPDWGEGSIYYLGELKEEKPHGLGRSYYKNGNINYQGHWVGGKKHGLGRLYNEEGFQEFDGCFTNDKRND